MQENIYLPSSSERKRAITAYLLVGVLFFSGKSDLSVYEYYHFKQAIGRYTATMFFLLVLLFVSIIPFVRILAFISTILAFGSEFWSILHGKEYMRAMSYKHLGEKESMLILEDECLISLISRKMFTEKFQMIFHRNFRLCEYKKIREV